MPSESYLKLKPDGTLSLVYMEESKRSITTDIINKIASNASRKLDNAFLLHRGAKNPLHCGLVISKAECYAFATLDYLCLETGYQVSEKDNLLRPVFIPKGELDHSTEFPVFRGEWSTPDTMRLVFAARIQNHQSANPSTYHKSACFLFAYDVNLECYRLPLPNLYDDGSLCMGQFDGQSNCIAGAFELAYSQLCTSKWNTDLIDSTKIKQAEKLFVFAAETDTIKTLHKTSAWAGCCNKISTPVSDIVGGNVS